MYYIFVFLGTCILATGLIFLKRPFFNLAISTTGLMNVMLDRVLDEDAKHKKLIRSLGFALKHLFGFLLFLGAVVVMSMLPFWVYEYKWGFEIGEDTPPSTLWTAVYLILGSFPLFVVGYFQPKKDYSDWSKLLHQLLLDNYNLMRALYNLEKRLFRKKLKRDNETFVIVTGLARAGTTAFNNLLFQAGKFHSLTYANMPFLLAPNCWKLIHNPQKAKLKERLHGDKVLFGVQSIEALEEYFFKVNLNDGYIGDSVIHEHDIDELVYRNYIDYQNLLKSSDSDTLYLAKNNNFMLRYRSMRQMNDQFKVALMFRHPKDHAQSLLNQHRRFTKIQQEDPFALQYMDWLGHHEFGLNTKLFEFQDSPFPLPDDKHDINFWLKVWMNYYGNILKMLDDQFVLISYDDFCNNPNMVLSELSEKWGIALSVDGVSEFVKPTTKFDKGDENLIRAALQIYNALEERKF